MGTQVSQKPPLLSTCPVLASTSSSSPSSSNIKIEHVLDSSSSASSDPSLQSSAAASTRRPSPPAPPSASLVSVTALPLSEPPAAASAQTPQYRHHKPPPLPSSTSPGQSMAAAVVVSQPTHAMQPFPRPIRFVANDGQPHNKRRRISAACKTCRKRKTRCSGEKPVCDTCRQNGHSCLGYSDPTIPSTPSHNSQQKRQNNQQVSSEPTPTPAAITPKELKESLFAATTCASPQDHRRNPQQRPSIISQQSGLLSQQHEQRGTTTPSRTRSQKRKSFDYHQGKSGKGDQWDVDRSRAESKGGGGLIDEGPSPDPRYQTPPDSQRLAHRMPYFRYFGPTAIVPGYKQMVVEVKNRSNRPRHASHSISANSSGTSPASTFVGLGGLTPMPMAASGAAEEIPFYDPNDTAPNSPLIAHLIETFFMHLGCNFPFLRRDSFTRDVEEKRVDAILVDAVCAVAARFSSHPLLHTTSMQVGGMKASQCTRRCEYGTAFANRAKSQVVDTFACPNLATVQACILLAYVEFGSNRDSGLWMFLGIAIRMAQDLGLQKLEGTRGNSKERIRTRSRSTGSEDKRYSGNKLGDRSQEEEMKDREAEIRERERTDTFWAVIFLDRVISSGTGRPVTIRDKEVEVGLPIDKACSPYPPPFPALVRIVHLYGRVTDLLNSINDVNTVNPDTFSRLAGMEEELTTIYQQLSPNLHFSVPNFEHYSSTNQSAVFLLLHIWFHTLIVLLHRPTLLIAFEGRVQQLFPNSRELSMSSAKTISDILAFAELIDPRAVNGNPFTSQPIYIAACAFLQESLMHSSNPTSRSSSPPPSGAPQPINAPAFGDMESVSPRDMGRPPTTGLGSPASSTGVGWPSDIKLKNSAEDASSSQKISQKHALLAQAAHRDYQRCYKALKGLEIYWEGVKYILTVLDQKAKGIVDPLLYTAEEMESVEVHYWGPNMWSRFRNIQGDAKEGISVPVKVEQTLLPSSSMFGSNRVPERVPSPLMTNIHSEAFGLSATGTTNSPNLNLTWFFANNEHNQNPQVQFATASSTSVPLSPHDHRGGMQSSMHPPLPQNSFVQHGTPTPTASPVSKYSLEASTPASDAEMLLGLSGASQKPAFGQPPEHHGMDGIAMGNVFNDGNYANGVGPGFGYVMTESENVNMHNLGWNFHCLEYMPPYWDGNYPAADEVG